jgi:hypothetical protein
MLQAAGFQRRQHFDNYQQLTKRAMQEVLTFADQIGLSGVTLFSVKASSRSKDPKYDPPFLFSAPDEKQKYLEQILHIFALHNYLNCIIYKNLMIPTGYLTPFFQRIGRRTVFRIRSQDENPNNEVY